MVVHALNQADLWGQSTQWISESHGYIERPCPPVSPKKVNWQILSLVEKNQQNDMAVHVCVFWVQVLDSILSS